MVVWILVLSEVEHIPLYLPSSAYVLYDKLEVRYRFSMFDDDVDVYHENWLTETRIANLKICIGPDDRMNKICWFGHVHSLCFRVGFKDTALLDGLSNFTTLHIHSAAESQGQFRAGQKPYRSYNLTGMLVTDTFLRVRQYLSFSRVSVKISK